MQCSWVTGRLVAFQDDELSRSEFTIVTEHLDGCASCQQLEQSLRDATPEPFLEIPPDVMASMARAVEDALEEEFTRPQQAVAPSTWQRSSRWLRKDRDTPNGALLGYGLLLAACLGWGVSNWFAVQALQAEVERPSVALSAPAPATEVVVPSDQYRPASWTPDAESEDWR